MRELRQAPKFLPISLYRVCRQTARADARASKIQERALLRERMPQAEPESMSDNRYYVKYEPSSIACSSSDELDPGLFPAALG